jgi:hypothetical protein
MTIEIGFRLSKDGCPKDGTRDLATVSEMDLRYDLFLGDLWLRVDGMDFSAPWNWIPILDAAVSFRRIVDDFEHGKDRAVFEFTESNHEIRFERERDQRICVTTTFADGEGRVTLSDLRSSVHTFFSRILEEAVIRCPDLKQNARFLDWYRDSLSGGKT